jgi:amidase
VSGDPDLLFRSAADLAGLVRRGDVTSRELVEASLARIEALDPGLGAFTTLDADRALATADAIGPGDERPFAGVPFAIKDLFPVAGVRMTMGSDLFGDFVPKADSFAMRRIKDAGFVIVGMTSTPEFGIQPVTEPRRFGPTRNPWDPARTPGGSSGGAAAAVAAGMVPAAHGSDGGGSIRIPAACCGLVGLKPARGRISLGPAVGGSMFATHGALTRTVADTALLLDVLAGYEPGDSFVLPEPEAPFATAVEREPGQLRIAISTTPPIEGVEVDPLCLAATQEAAGLLTELGHTVEEATPPWAAPGITDLFSLVYWVDCSLAVLFGSLVSGREPTPELIEPMTHEIWRRAQETTGVAYRAGVVQLERIARHVAEFLDPYDALLTPTLAERPVPIGTMDTSQPDPIKAFERGWSFTPFTAQANVGGMPAISLPLVHGDDGLPVGVQLFGRPAGESQLLSLAAQVERARPWADRRPSLPEA